MSFHPSMPAIAAVPTPGPTPSGSTSLLARRVDPHLDTDDDDNSDIMSIDSRSSRNAPSSVTSMDDASMRSASPAPSVYSVTSSIRAAAYRHEYGRGVNNYSDIYWLPADDEELERLGAQ
jgi:hypothetical protein